MYLINYKIKKWILLILKTPHLIILISKNKNIKFDDYVLEIDKKVGEGGFGEVYWATNTILNKAVAIKIEKPEDFTLKVEVDVLNEIKGGRIIIII